MMKNKKTIILTSVLCMLPEILSLILYKRLPEQIAVHWNGAGEIDGYLPKAMAAFGMPLGFLLINLFTNISLLYDPRREGQPKALRAIINWIIPITSLILVPATLLMSIGVKIPIISLTYSIVGFVFSLIGNYLPKSKKNYMMGVRIPWTFHDPDNWNKTNRITGHIMVIGGVVILVSAYLQKIAVLYRVSIFVVITALIIVIPFFYSFFLYKKEQDKNTPY